MIYNKEKGTCVYCGKNVNIYKDGYCKSCYSLILKTKYILKPNTRFRVDSEREMIDYFLKHPDIDKKELAKKFNVAISTVYYNIDKHTIKIKVEN